MKKNILSVITLLFAVTQVFSATSLYKNSGFEEANETGDWARWWSRGNGATYEEEGGNHFIRITSGGINELNTFYSKVDLPDNTELLELKFRVRYKDVELGVQPWHDARLMINAIDKKGNKKYLDGTPYFRGTIESWKNVSHKIEVPSGTVAIEIMPCLFNAKSGVLDIDDMFLFVKDAKKEKGIANMKMKMFVEKEKTERAFTSDDELKVVGNKLINGRGEEVWLQGVAIPSLEWLASGDHIEQSTVTAVTEWNANVIRLATKSIYWFGRGEKAHNKRTDGGESYRKLVDDVIEFANNRGCYVVIDLHEYKAPTEKHIEFWKSVAERYKNRPGVMFDLLNEPHSITWEEWRDGGKISGKRASDAPVESNESMNVSESVGMQRLIDEVRATGAKNIVICGGLDWAYDLWGIENGFALEDKEGNGIMYSTHVYPWKSDWANKFLMVAEKHPIFMGEVGCWNDKMPWETSLVDPYVWGPVILACIQKHKLNWTAWSFHTGASPCVLKNWDYEPTPCWGSFVKAALKGAKFVSDKQY